MKVRSGVGLAAFGAAIFCSAGARADQSGSSVDLPTFAQSAPSTPQSASDPWRGLYVGSGLSFASGRRGGFGGEAYAGYDRIFANNLVLGVRGAVGYAPNLFPHSPISGFNYAETSERAGYRMGQLTPFVTVGAVFAKPSLPFTHYTGPMDSANDLFNSAGRLQTLTTVGAGFDYAFNKNVSFELSVSATQSNGSTWPAWSAWPAR